MMPSDEQPVLVWYRIVDSRGSEFKNTQAIGLWVTPTTVIHDFLVKVYEDYSDLLGGARAPQLHVFKNKVSRDMFARDKKGREKEDWDTNEQPLKPSDTLKGLGTDCQSEAVIVVVPDNEWKRSRLEPGPVSRSKWFISDIRKIEPAVVLSAEEWVSMTYNGMVSNLKVKSPMTEQTNLKFFKMKFPVLLSNDGGGNKVFVRPCYETIFDLLLHDLLSAGHDYGYGNGTDEDDESSDDGNMEKGAKKEAWSEEGIRKEGRQDGTEEGNKDATVSIVVTGSPGIGKSRFYAYCVLRLSELRLADRTIVVNTGNRYYILEGESFRKLSLEEVELYRDADNVVRLIDGQSSKLLGWSGVSILFTTCGFKDYYEFQKSPGSEYVMPPWTCHELRIAAGLLEMDKDKISARFYSFGGIARYVLAPKETTFDHNLHTAIAAIDLPKLKWAVANGGREISEQKYSHRLCQTYPKHKNGNPYKGSFLSFASDEIADMILKRMARDSYKNLKDFIMANQEDVNSGCLFKMLCHCLWSSPGTHKLKGRYLTPSRKSAFSIQIPNIVPTCRFMDLSQIPEFTIKQPLYCQSITNRFSSINAIYWDGSVCYLVQIAISEMQVVEYDHLAKILEWCKERRMKLLPVFVFVVPQDKLTKYTGSRLLKGVVYEESRSEDVKGLAQCVLGVNVGKSLKHVAIVGNA